MLSDLINLINWWGILFLIGIIFLPITSNIFYNFFDRGYIFSKTLGVIIISYLVWSLSSLHILKYSATNLVITIVFFALVNIFVIRKTKFKLERSLIKTIFFEEVLFFVLLAIWAYIRSLAPNINNIEKFMDFGFLNSILNTQYMPPSDMWFSGFSINYYYFGHLIAATIIKLSFVESSIGYNLMIASIFSLSFVMSFSMVSNLLNFKFNGVNTSKAILGGLISSLLLTLGGNLHTFSYTILLPALKRFGLYHGYIKNYWYADASRYIGYFPQTNDKAIVEFPAYSLIIGDLHAHLNDLIIIILFLSVLLSFIIKLIKKNSNFILFHTILLGLLLGVMLMINTWDYPIYIFLTAISLFIIGKKYNTNVWKSFIIIVIASLLFASMYLIKFNSMTHGIVLSDVKTPLYQIFILWGLPILIMLFAIILGFRFKRKCLNISDLFVVLIFMEAIILVLTPELFYLKDICISEYKRANTMFKLSFNASVLFSLAVGYISIIIFTSKEKFSRYFKTLTVIFLCMPFLFTLYSIIGYYGNSEFKYKGLDGTKFLDIGDRDAILWLKENCKDNCKIVEAVGDAYTNFGRISAMSGIPTIVGWPNHEWLWRKSEKLAYDRVRDVNEIYSGKDLEHSREMLEKYDTKYLIYGYLEKQKYPNVDESRFNEIGRIVFDKNGMKIYEITLNVTAH